MKNWLMSHLLDRVNSFASFLDHVLRGLCKTSMIILKNHLCSFSLQWNSWLMRPCNWSLTKYLGFAIKCFKIVLKAKRWSLLELLRVKIRGILWIYVKCHVSWDISMKLFLRLSVRINEVNYLMIVNFYFLINDAENGSF